MGDSFRQLSDKSVRAWNIERWVVHSVVVFVTLMTTAVIYSYLGNDTSKYWLTKKTFIIEVGVLLAAVFDLVKSYSRVVILVILAFRRYGQGWLWITVILVEI